MHKKIYLIALASLIFIADNGNANEQKRIGLQNTSSREIVYCYDNSSSSAEECATYFEGQGFIKMKLIPSKPAKFDFLTVDTFPTRRWRDNELTPRW